MDYSQQFDKLIAAKGEEYVFQMLLFTVIGMLIFQLGIFIIKSIAVCKMARKRGYKNWWLGMIPYVNYYILGKLAGPVRLFRIDIKNIGIFVMIALIFSDIYSVIYSLSLFGINLFGPFVILYQLFSLFFTVVDFIYIFAYCTLLLAIFGKYAPEKRFLFLLLSIVRVVFPFVLLAIMNNKPYNNIDDYYREKMANRFGQTYNPYSDPFSTQENPYQQNNSTKRDTVEDPFDEYKENK
ncbi:MAG: hypothetical protein IJA15_01040 [Clostridia bacterium]|nr:hypothetical protein [Clostridia bacterium]